MMNLSRTKFRRNAYYLRLTKKGWSIVKSVMETDHSDLVFHDMKGKLTNAYPYQCQPLYGDWLALCDLWSERLQPFIITSRDSKERT